MYPLYPLSGLYPHQGYPRRSAALYPVSPVCLPSGQDIPLLLQSIIIHALLVLLIGVVLAIVAAMLV